MDKLDDKVYNKWIHSGSFNESQFVWEAIKELKDKINEIIDRFSNEDN